MIFLLRTSLTDDPARDASPAAEAHRFLSVEGRRLVRALGNKVRLDEAPSIDRFVTSPAPAAVQTAELFADRVDYVGMIEVLPSLAGNVPPPIAASLLLAHGTAVVVVADEPALSALGAFLVGRPTFPPLEHAQLSVIEGRQPSWTRRHDDIGRRPLLVA